MQQEPRILHLEDDPKDQELVRAVLEDAGLGSCITHATTGEDFERALTAAEWDLVLADYHLPGYTGVDALRFAREMRPDVPFLFVSGTMGEDAAIDGLTEGATDYVLKRRLSRLRPAVLRALSEADNRRARRRAEYELHKLSRAVEQSANTVVITDTNGIIEYANPACSATSGYSAQELLGRHTRVLKSGRTSPATYQQLWSTIGSGRQWRGVLLNKRKNGDLFWESVSISPIKDDAGRITNYLAVKEDITELTKAEEARKQLEEELRHAQKLEALGTLAGGVAHDFNNLLSVIGGYGEMLQARLPDDDPSHHDVAEILKAVERATQVCRALLAFGRKQPSRLAPLSVNDLIAGMKSTVLPLLGEHVETRFALADAPLTVIGDAGQLEQVILNLATNARDAMPQGGVLTIETAQVDIDDAFIREHGFGCTGPCASIRVSDTGAGMDASTRQRMFEPFFTTKPAERGTGLGLSIAYGIVTQHHGHIECTSQPGAGTTFRVYLPTVQGRIETLRDAVMDRAPRGHETVLIAEDDEAIRSLFRRVLEGHGYEVIAACDGADALARFGADPDRVDLVLLDAIMPNKNGRQALEEMRAIRPDIKALFISGYGEGLAPDGLGSVTATDVITKPVKPRELLGRVRECLDQPLAARHA